MALDMKAYKNTSGTSGVLAYESGKTFIRVKFLGGQVYTYSYRSAGKRNVEAMKVLAGEGRGLAGFISKYVKDGFEF